eukprot:scaffold103311_cov56-Phaeocystis_antarctica.AAC.3
MGSPAAHAAADDSGVGGGGGISEQPPMQRLVNLTLTLLQRDVFVFIADIADNAGLDISPEQ